MIAQNSAKCFMVRYTLVVLLIFVLSGCNVQGKNLLVKTESKVVFSARNEKGIFRLYLSDGLSKRKEVKTVFNRDCITPIFSPSGKGIIFSEFDGHDFELEYIDLRSGIPRMLTDNDYDDYAPAWSPDSARIAWCRVPEKTLLRADEAEIFVSEWPDIKERQLTHNARMDAYPVFTSDGNALIIESGRADSLFGLFKVGWNGNEVPLLYEPQSSGNGIPHVYKNFCVFERTDISNHNFFEVWLLNLGTSAELQKKSDGATPCNPSPRISPDGKWIAYHWAKGKSSEIVLLPFVRTSENPQKVFRINDSFLKLPRWNRNGAILIAEDSNHNCLVVFDIEGRKNELYESSGYRYQRFMEIYNFDVF